MASLLSSVLEKAKGYRAKYINALNDAVSAIRIGASPDIYPVSSPSGTQLFLSEAPTRKAFTLAYAYDLNKSADGVAVAYGRIISDVSAARPYVLPEPGKTLEESENFPNLYTLGGLMPFGEGWFCPVMPEADNPVYIEIIKSQYNSSEKLLWIVARKDSQTYADLNASFAAAERVARIGYFSLTPTSDGTPLYDISQDIERDIVLPAGESEAAPILYSHALRVQDSVDTSGSPKKVIAVYAPNARSITDYGDLTSVRQMYFQAAENQTLEGVREEWFEVTDGGDVSTPGIKNVYLYFIDDFTFKLVALPPNTFSGAQENYYLIGSVTTTGILSENGDVQLRFDVSSPYGIGWVERTLDYYEDEIVLAYDTVGGVWTADLSSLDWTQEVDAYICGQYSLVAKSQFNGQAVLKRPIPIRYSNRGELVMYFKRPAISHAADHFDVFIPVE